MTHLLRRIALFLALALAAIPVGCGGPRPPRLVVLISVDQLRADFLERFGDLYEGGFRWLLDRGAHFPNAAYRHAATVTGVGHATISTGLHPSSHGVVGNSWFEPGRGSVYCVEGGVYGQVGGPGSGAAPLALEAETLGSALKKTRPGSTTYSFSTKDRSAVLLAGRLADGAFWYEPDCGCLVGSEYYGEALPTWLAAFNAQAPAAAYAGKEWTRLLPDTELYERMAREDAFPTEADGVQTAFPHRLPQKGVEAALARTPFADEITLAAALAAVRAGVLGAGDQTDLLALGLSATDSIGHRYGPFSQEAMDHHLRLDGMLGDFFEALDEEIGLESVTVALSADHGALPLVEHLQARGIAAERFDAGALWKRAAGTIETCARGSAEEAVAQAAGTRFYWNDDTLRERNVRRGEASACLAAWLRDQPGIAAVFTAEQLAAGGGDRLEILFRNSFFAGRSAHVQVHLREFVYPGGPRGTGHGSAHEYDRRVPVLLSGAGIVPGRYERSAGPEDIAPSLGALLGLDLPLEPDTRILSEALR